MRRQLVIVFGAPGVGKSTLAKRLASELHCLRLDKDFISDIFRASDRDTPADRGMAYQIIENVVRGALEDADRIIVEAPLTKQMAYPIGTPNKHPDHFATIAKALDAELKLIYLWCDDTILHRRIMARGLERDRDKMSPEGFEKFAVDEGIRVDIKSLTDAYDLCAISTQAPIDQQISAGLAYLRRRPKGSSGNTVGDAWRASFGFKRPIREGKRGSLSLPLWLFAVLFWAHRFIAPIQWIKFIARWLFLDRGKDPIPPLVAEIVTIAGIGLLIVNLWVVSAGAAFIPLPFWLICAFLLWQTFDVAMANLYYLMLRPIVDHDPPHNSYRSFILGWFGFLQLTLLLSTLWYYVAIAGHVANIRLATIFGQVLKGDSPVPAMAEHYAALDVFSKITYGIMLTVILGRAISLVPPLPSDPSPGEKNV